MKSEREETNMYLLMNKDKEIMQFNTLAGPLGNSYEIISQNEDQLPYGFTNIAEWISTRKGSKHNAHLKQIMKDCGCEDDLGYIRVTHAASLNDTYWIKNELESVTWNDVSFYRNEFDEQISKLAFEGVGLYGIKLSSTSPELCTEGSFRKCWKREDGEIYLYKRGTSGAMNAGLEPYCEMMASEIAAQICDNAISYQKVTLHGEIASKCHLFTTESVGYVPYAKLKEDTTANAMLDFYASIGSEDKFRQMLVLDALTFNVDRHAGNHGVSINNDTKQILGMAPIFDLNLSLLPYVLPDEFENIGNKMLEYGPRIGDDFTRIGQMALTPAIRAKLINLKGFEFSFRGNETFSKERVHFLEQMIERQITGLLSKEQLYTKDVFVPEQAKEIQPVNSDVGLNSAADDLADNLQDILPEALVSEMNDSSNDFVIVSLNEAVEIYISVSDFSVEIYVGGQLADESSLTEEERMDYTKICQAVDDFELEYANFDDLAR